VLFGGVGLYRTAASDRAMLETYGRGTPDDWLERNVYDRHHVLGVLLMLTLDLVLFGAAGAVVWLVQMVWIPFWAAGVINGIGHYWGYRSFETADASRNIVPIGLLIGGEEFHNNHHAYSYSAKLGNKWWELDFGWYYICLLEVFGLATVKRVAPRTAFASGKRAIDAETLRAVVANRFHVLKLYGRRVIAPVLQGHTVLELGFPRRQLARVRKLMTRHGAAVKDDPNARAWLETALERNHRLQTVHQFFQRLNVLSQQSARTDSERVNKLQAWCAEAEASGIRVLRDFAEQLQAYTAQPA
jgi:stearoyl-CoA desaturase (delta-9 desaturase)